MNYWLVSLSRTVFKYPRTVTGLTLDRKQLPTMAADGGQYGLAQAKQDDFDTLFEVLMPSRLNNIKLRSMATDEGSEPGAFTYALFNSDVIEYELMKQILVEMNRKGYEKVQPTSVPTKLCRSIDGPCPTQAEQATYDESVKG